MTIINDGRLGWDDGVADMVHDLKRRDVDKRLLANRLLAQSDGSLVAEGMAIVVQENLPDAERILARYDQDSRWNRWQSSNHEFAKVCLLALKMKKNNPIAQEERELLNHWQDVLNETFGL